MTDRLFEANHINNSILKALHTSTLVSDSSGFKTTVVVTDAGMHLQTGPQSMQLFPVSALLILLALFVLYIILKLVFIVAVLSIAAYCSEHFDAEFWDNFGSSLASTISQYINQLVILLRTAPSLLAISIVELSRVIVRNRYFIARELISGLIETLLLAALNALFQCYIAPEYIQFLDYLSDLLVNDCRRLLDYVCSIIDSLLSTACVLFNIWDIFFLTRVLGLDKATAIWITRKDHPYAKYILLCLPIIEALIVWCGLLLL